MKPLRLLLFAAAAATSAAAGASGPSPLGEADSLAACMERAGMVDLKTDSPSIEVSLMYGRDDNFTGAAMYPAGFDKAYLHPEASQALAAAQKALSAEHPGYRLKIADAARPMSVQTKMYNTVKGTPMAPYVSNPARGGGLHNYGLAVDVTIVDATGREIPMGTKIDHLGPEANIHREKQLVAQGKITEAARQNRILLRRVMKTGGFMPLRSEWWHFNLRSRADARARYRRLDF